MKQKVKVWDLPTRLFHWILVLAVAFMWYSAETGGSLMAWHLRVGLLVLGLLVFRVCWGLWGSDTARFSRFVRGPGEIKRYIRGGISENEQPGHNPLGALMVLALLGGLLFQVVTGLFSPDNNAFVYNGFLNGWVDEGTGSLMHTLHVNFFNILLALIAVHVATILVYKYIKKHNLITPMMTGFKHIEGKVPPLKFAGAGSVLAALAVAAAVVCTIWFGA